MKITIFTPTYNRAYILHNLYESLINQQCFNFEWLVIDDGSTDDTKLLFDKWKAECKLFDIRYYYFENVGKPKEINRALDLAKGELFWVVDSDDRLTSNAVKLINKWYEDIPKNGKFCAFAGNHGDFAGNSVNKMFEEAYKEVNFLNRYSESGLFIGYDRPWVFFTDIHRKYKYPEYDGETFITEAVAWNRMAYDGYKIRCYNDVIYLYEHQEDGLTNGISKILKNNPQGFGLWRRELALFFNYSIKEYLKMYYSFYCDEKEICSIKEIAKYIGSPRWLMYCLSIIFKIKHR